MILSLLCSFELATGLCKEGERVVRAERARRALETLRAVKRKTPGGTKKGKKK